MAKMKLDLDALQVESFDTAAAALARGTVHAQSDGEPQPGDVALLPITDWKTCQGGDCTARTLCYYSCNGDCYAVDPVNGAIAV
ncbi:MAG TPA: hypothetical protein VFJ82_10015 [Longimicrobium sp.]|nr:hypothetical protein [Longimicrobium sp.]